jgi:hypothetical protein
VGLNPISAISDSRTQGRKVHLLVPRFSLEKIGMIRVPVLHKVIARIK